MEAGSGTAAVLAAGTIVTPCCSVVMSTDAVLKKSASALRCHQG